MVQISMLVTMKVGRRCMPHLLVALLMLHGESQHMVWIVVCSSKKLTFINIEEIFFDKNISQNVKLIKSGNCNWFWKTTCSFESVIHGQMGYHKHHVLASPGICENLSI